jgi:hypothetical protein
LVVDSTDERRLTKEIQKDFLVFLNHEDLVFCNILVFVTKIDIDKTERMSIEKIKLILEELLPLKHKKIFFQPCNPTKGTGLKEGFDWLSKSFDN